MRQIAVLLLVLSLFMCGCVHLPSASLPGAVSTVGKVPLSGQVPSGSPAHQAIQKVVNWQTMLFVLGGLACLAFGGLAIYGGQVLPGIKLVIGGLLLPVFGIWFAYHWLLVTIIVLIGGALFLLLTHYTVLRPALAAIETWAKTIEIRLAGASKAVPGVPAVSAVPVVVVEKPVTLPIKPVVPTAPVLVVAPPARA